MYIKQKKQNTCTNMKVKFGFRFKICKKTGYVWNNLYIEKMVDEETVGITKHLQNGKVKIYPDRLRPLCAASILKSHIIEKDDMLVPQYLIVQLFEKNKDPRSKDKYNIMYKYLLTDDDLTLDINELKTEFAARFNGK